MRRCRFPFGRLIAVGSPDLAILSTQASSGVSRALTRTPASPRGQVQVGLQVIGRAFLFTVPRSGAAKRRPPPNFPAMALASAMDSFTAMGGMCHPTEKTCSSTTMEKASWFNNYVVTHFVWCPRDTFTIFSGKKSFQKYLNFSSTNPKAYPDFLPEIALR